MLSIYLVVSGRLYFEAAVATAIVAVVVHRLATPIPGVGISVPLFWPPILAAVAALVLSRRHAAPLAYVAGSIGVLIGADLANLDKLQKPRRAGRLDRRRGNLRRRVSRRRRRRAAVGDRPAARRDEARRA